MNYPAHKPLEIEPAEDSRGVRRKGYAADRRWQRLSQFFYEDRVEPVRPSELHQHHEQGELESGETKPSLGH